MQGFNKYYPPNYDESQGSLNKLNGKHALGDRARKIDQGILITRFELPYNIWCGGCDNMIGMGVRYNSEKKKVGMYYSTPIFSFRCKCHLCSNWFEIRTDPQNTRYVVVAGARQKNEEWDPAENGGHAIIEDKPLIDLDAFASLEKTNTQKTRSLTAAQSLSALEDLQHSRWSDPYAVSSLLRKSFRGEKVVRVASQTRAEEVRDRYGLGERVGIEDLRTPVRQEDLEEERIGWEAVKGERRRRENIRQGKGKLDGGDTGWGGAEEGTRGSSKSQRASASSSSSSSRPRALSSRRVEPNVSTTPSTGTTTLSTGTTKPSTTHLSSLTSQILHNSAAQSDPFRINTGLEKSRLISSNEKIRGMVKLSRKTGS